MLFNRVALCAICTGQASLSSKTRLTRVILHIHDPFGPPHFGSLIPASYVWLRIVDIWVWESGKEGGREGGREGGEGGREGREGGRKGKMEGGIEKAREETKKEGGKWGGREMGRWGGRERKGVEKNQLTKVHMPTPTKSIIQICTVVHALLYSLHFDANGWPCW